MKPAAVFGLKLALAICAGFTATGAQAQAGLPGPAAQAFGKFVTEGTLAEGEMYFSRLPATAEHGAALGMIRFVQAVERLGQGMYTYGLRRHRASRNLPFFRLPVPENPSPSPLTYATMREVYVQFLADITRAEATLASLPAGEVKLPVDLFSVNLNFAGAGQSPLKVTLGTILARMRLVGAPASGNSQSLVAAFDRADMVWLRGYCKLLSALTEFILAHDWRETYAATAHLFFSGARDPSAANETNMMFFGQDSGAIADAIALIHLIRWPVAEPERLLRVREHLKSAVVLSRENWKAILSETDDDREWLPGPQQKNSVFPGMAVTQAQIAGWHEALDGLEAALDGRKLIPHWRFHKGFDLNAFFTQPRTFDLVLWFTGHGALPYMKDGPTISQQDWLRWQRIFGGRFINFAIWFN